MDRVQQMQALLRDDTPLAFSYAYARTIRMAFGPDAIDVDAIAGAELAGSTPADQPRRPGRHLPDRPGERRIRIATAERGAQRADRGGSARTGTGHQTRHANQP